MISLIRFYQVKNGLKIYFDFLFASGSTIKIRTEAFKNDIFLRKEQSDPFIFDQVFTEQQYDFPHSSPASVKWIIDAGANIGMAAIWFSHRFPNARIICIEPDANNFELLKRNTIGYPNVTHIHGALWHKNEKLNIFNSSEKSAGYMMAPVQDKDENYIQAYTVSQLVRQFNMERVSILKVDIEGSEKEVFEFGSHDWLPVTECVITELHDNLKAGTSQIFFREMSHYNWNTYVKGENIICLKDQPI